MVARASAASGGTAVRRKLGVGRARARRAATIQRRRAVRLFVRRYGRPTRTLRQSTLLADRGRRGGQGAWAAAAAGAVRAQRERRCRRRSLGRRPPMRASICDDARGRPRTTLRAGHTRRRRPTRPAAASRGSHPSSSASSAVAAWHVFAQSPRPAPCAAAARADRRPPTPRRGCGAHGRRAARAARAMQIFVKTLTGAPPPLSALRNSGRSEFAAGDRRRLGTAWSAGAELAAASERAAQFWDLRIRAGRRCPLTERRALSSLPASPPRR